MCVLLLLLLRERSGKRGSERENERERETMVLSARVWEAWFAARGRCGYLGSKGI
jgi:hypothetical protein